LSAILLKYELKFIARLNVLLDLLILLSLLLNYSFNGEFFNIIFLEVTGFFTWLLIVSYLFYKKEELLSNSWTLYLVGVVEITLICMIVLCLVFPFELLYTANSSTMGYSAQSPDGLKDADIYCFTEGIDSQDSISCSLQIRYRVLPFIRHTISVVDVYTDNPIQWLDNQTVKVFERGQSRNFHVGIIRFDWPSNWLVLVVILPYLVIKYKHIVLKREII
jgi:hypothetical protein